MAKVVDDEIKKIVESQYDKAKKILEKNKDNLKTIAKRLLDKEVLDAEEVKELIGFKNEDNSSKDRKSEPSS